MAIVFVDTNIVIDYLKERNNEALVEFVDSFDTVYINDVVIMELYQGARDKRELNYIKKKIMKFEVLKMNQEIISLAREILDRYTLSHNTKIMDALIASTYTVPHCQDHLKKILIPPIYDTLSNMSIASNS